MIYDSGHDEGGGYELSLNCFSLNCPYSPTKLTSTPAAISLTAGGVETLSIDAGPIHAGGGYIVLSSMSGWTPGIPIGPVLSLPLNYDAFLLAAARSINLPPYTNSMSTLDAVGRGTCQFTVPPQTPALPPGLKVFHTALIFAGVPGGSQMLSVLNPVALSFLP